MKTIYLLIGSLCLLTACSSEKNEDATKEPTATETKTWTCSMHPSIQQPEPGDCPICGMDLIPLVEDSGSDLGPREMRMSESAKALADIQTTEVVRDYPVAEIRLVGQLEYDETRMRSLTARYPARIDQLYVNYAGIRVDAGEHLAKVYSPELLSAQQELLSAHRSNPDGVIAQAAREKLLLWDLLPQQIEGILESGKARDSFELLAPIGGVVVDKQIKEGAYVKTGEPLLRIADLSQLWLDLRAYESDLNWLRFGQSVNFTVESFPGETFEGMITFIEPEVDQKTRTVSVRVNVPNKDNRLKPGMLARGLVQAKLNASGKVHMPKFAGKWISPMHPEIIKDEPGTCDVCGMDLVSAESLGYVETDEGEAPLLVPSSAVLRTGKRAVVYVEKDSEDESNRYEGREITLGPRAGDRFIVASGLMAGDRVVTNGAFKIDSALQIQAKPSMMSAEDHGDASSHNDHGEHENSKMVSVPAEQVADLLPHYFSLHKALAGDDLEGAKAALKGMMKVTGHSGALPDLIHSMLSEDSLDGLRRPHFEMISNGFIKAIEANPSAISRPVYLMNCPMVYQDRGADWLQNDDQLLNPYFGSSMLRCGDLKKEMVKEKESAEKPVDQVSRQLADLLPHYFALQKALAGDDLEGAKGALKAMMKVTGHTGALPDLIHTMLNAEDLDGVRRPHFEALSNAFIDAVKANESDLGQKVYHMNCSMVYPERGADWLQDNSELVNPYWGSGMLHCGSQKGTWGEGREARGETTDKEASK